MLAPLWNSLTLYRLESDVRPATTRGSVNVGGNPTDGLWASQPTPKKATPDAASANAKYGDRHFGI